MGNEFCSKKKKKQRKNKGGEEKLVNAVNPQQGFGSKRQTKMMIQGPLAREKSSREGGTQLL